MKEIDYVKISEFKMTLEPSRRKGSEFKEYRNVIVALHETGWRHTHILAFFYSSVEGFIGVARKIDNNDLSRYLSHLKSLNLIDRVEVEKEKCKILGISGSERSKAKESELSIYGVTYTVLDFSKELKRQGVLIENEMDGIKEHYKNNANRSDLSELVKSYLSEKSSFIAG